MLSVTHQTYFTPARKLLGAGFGLFILVVLLLLNAASSGVVRSGGEDSGSGIGGTGRALIPGGGSGLGGTGLKPFVSVNEAGNVEILTSPAEKSKGVAASLEFDLEPEIAVGFAPLETRVVVIDPDQLSTDSAPIDISEEIQRSIDKNVLYLTEKVLSPARAIAATMTQPSAVALAPIHNSSTEANTAGNQAVPEIIDTPEQIQVQGNQPISRELDWNILSQFLLTNSKQGEPDSDDSDSTQVSDIALEEERARRPDRIQRPEIPPIQRYRPIQRSAILPPRIKPLSL